VAFFFPDIIFDLSLENCCSYNCLWEVRKLLILVDGGKRESTLDVRRTFEGMEVSRDNVRSLKSYNKISQTLLGLVA
jgi:hypothetical protein